MYGCSLGIVRLAKSCTTGSGPRPVKLHPLELGDADAVVDEVRRPQRVDALASTMDVFPTILAFLGIDGAESMDLDGVDLLPLLAGKSTEVRSEVFIEQYAEKFKRRRCA